MSGRNEVNIRMTADEADLVRGWLKARRAGSEYEKQLKKITEQANKSSKATKQTANTAKRSFASAAKDIAAVGAAIGTIHRLATLLIDQAEQMKRVESTAKDRYVDYGRARKMFYATGLFPGATYEGREDNVAQRILDKVDAFVGSGKMAPDMTRADMINLVAQSISAGTDSEVSKRVDAALEFTDKLDFYSKSDREAIIKGVVKMGEAFPEKSNEELLAVLQQISVKTPGGAEALPKLAEHIVPAINSAKQAGYDLKTSASMIAATMSASGDPTGEKTRTSFNQIIEDFATFMEIKRPEEMARLRKRMEQGELPMGKYLMTKGVGSGDFAASFLGIGNKNVRENAEALGVTPEEYVAFVQKGDFNALIGKLAKKGPLRSRAGTRLHFANLLTGQDNPMPGSAAYFYQQNERDLQVGQEAVQTYKDFVNSAKGDMDVFLYEQYKIAKQSEAMAYSQSQAARGLKQEFIDKMETFGVDAPHRWSAQLYANAERFVFQPGTPQQETAEYMDYVISAINRIAEIKDGRRRVKQTIDTDPDSPNWKDVQRRFLNDPLKPANAEAMLDFAESPSERKQMQALIYQLQGLSEQMDVLIQNQNTPGVKIQGQKPTGTTLTPAAGQD